MRNASPRLSLATVETLGLFHDHLRARGYSDKTAGIETRLIERDLLLVHEPGDQKLVHDYYFSLATRTRRQFRSRWSRFGEFQGQRGLEVAEAPKATRSRAWGDLYSVRHLVVTELSIIMAETGIPARALVRARRGSWRETPWPPGGEQGERAGRCVRLPRELGSNARKGADKASEDGWYPPLTREASGAHALVLMFGGSQEPGDPYIPVVPGSRLAISEALLRELVGRVGERS